LAHPDKVPPDSAEVIGDGNGSTAEENGLPGQPSEETPPPSARKVTVMESERELTTGLLSKDASFRLIVSGPIGVREIERLIRKLELDKEILAEQDENGDSE
jgi:hypothetical protein